LKVFDIIQNKKENKDISLILSDVYMKYSKRITGIKGLNLVVKKGSVLALLGMNGSGKSTTLKLIMNEFFKTIGNIYFNYREIKS
jgi:ABC-type multidrug transport system ATPase subunit